MFPYSKTKLTVTVKHWSQTEQFRQTKGAATLQEKKRHGKIQQTKQTKNATVPEGKRGTGKTKKD